MSIETTAASFRAAVSQLHREKTVAYRNSWKRRGETISIIANIARKVDRLESVVDGAPAPQDESLLDTAVDLFVYALKYQTFLADQDEDVAAALFGEGKVDPPYSDGVDGFEALLARVALIQLEYSPGQGLTEAAQHVLTAFAAVEAAFVEQGTSVSERVARADALVNEAIRLLAVLRYDAPEPYYDFLARRA